MVEAQLLKLEAVVVVAPEVVLKRRGEKGRPRELTIDALADEEQVASDVAEAALAVAPRHDRDELRGRAHEGAGQVESAGSTLH